MTNTKSYYRDEWKKMAGKIGITRDQLLKDFMDRKKFAALLKNFV